MVVKLTIISDSAFVFTVDQGLKVWFINMVWIVAGTTASIFPFSLFNSTVYFDGIKRQAIYTVTYFIVAY